MKLRLRRQKRTSPSERKFDINLANVCSAGVHRHATDEAFSGILCDIWTPKSVTRHKELNSILSALGINSRKVLPSNHRFRFSEAIFDSLGLVSIQKLTTPGVPPLFVEMEILNADVPALLGLDREILTP